jgi:solute carrier family 25 protein 14/30
MFFHIYLGAQPTIIRAAILTGTQLSSYDHSKRMLLKTSYFQDNTITHVM